MSSHRWMNTLPRHSATLYRGLLCIIITLAYKFYFFWLQILTYSMEQSLYWETKRFAASLEISRILWNPKVHYHIHKFPPPVSILSQLTCSPYPHIPLPEETSLYYPPSTPWSTPWSLSFGFPHQNPVHASPLPIRATYPTHLILLDFITRTILGEEYRSWSSSLWSDCQ
jgi:hypothetical protein